MVVVSALVEVELALAVFVRVLVSMAGTEAFWTVVLTEGVLVVGWIVAVGGLVARVVTSVAA